MTDIHKPKGDVKSYIVHWNKNVPEVRETHWAPGYTPAHCATPAEALAHAGVGLIQDIANIREKWLRLQTLGAHLSMETLANAFGQMVSAGAEEEKPIDEVEAEYRDTAAGDDDLEPIDESLVNKAGEQQVDEDAIVAGVDPD